MTNWRWINVAVFALVLVANGAAGSGALSGQSIGTLANQYASLFLPANYVFGIWSIIYIGQFTVLLHMIAPSSRGKVALQRLGPWWTIVGALNIAWVVLFSFAQFGPAMIVMLAFLAALIVIGERVRDGEILWLDRALLIWSRGLCMGSACATPNSPRLPCAPICWSPPSSRLGGWRWC
jgi:hypothetical protein